MSSDLVKLRQFIVAHYSLDELRTLCFDLGINYEEVGEGGSQQQSREFLLLTGREKLFDQLVVELEKGRPALFNEAKFNTDPAFATVLYAGLPAFSAGRNVPPNPVSGCFWPKMGFRPLLAMYKTKNFL